MGHSTSSRQHPTSFLTIGDRGESGGGWAPSSVRTSRRLNRIELSHSDQLLYCRWIDRRAALSDRGPRRSRRGRQQSLPHGTQITPSTVTCQSACAEAEDRPSRGGALRSSFREPQAVGLTARPLPHCRSSGGSAEYSSQSLRSVRNLAEGADSGKEHYRLVTPKQQSPLLHHARSPPGST